MAWTVERCLQEEPKLKRADIDHIKEWLKKQPHLPPMTDLEIATFLHCKKYDLERTKERIDKYFTIRTDNPDVFGNRDVLLPVNVEQQNFAFFAELPECDSNGYHVLAYGLQPVDDLSSLDFRRVFFLGYAMRDILTKEWPICPGYVFILDAQNLRLGHLTKLSIPFLNTFLTYVQEAEPIRIKKVHIINMNPFAEKIIQLIKPFLKKKMQKQLELHSGEMKEFYKALPKEMLPQEFGGTCGSLVDYHKNALKLILDNREQLIKDERKVNHALRPQRTDEMEGSFRMLDVD